MCAYRLARSIASPIDRLVAVVKAVAGGDLDVSTGIRPNNEIGTLAHAIDEMALRLKDATGQLREYSRSLEAARDEALAASLAKSLFLANMSHEIRTPLNAVIGMTELTLQSPLDPEQHENLSTVMEAGEFLLAVIDDILDFSKIESGKMELSPHVFDCRTLVRSVVSLFSARAEKLGIDLVLDMHEDTPAFIETDANRLRQVLVNLVGNAIKFTKNGSIRIAVRPEGPLQTKDIARLQFEIRDTGIGIPEGKQASIFNAFEQADNSHTRDYGGTGLGLAISRQLVALLGGSLSVTSAVGQGSTFRFAIVAPASSERSDDAPVAGKTTSAVDRATLTPARCAKVLLAEDNAVNRKLVERILSQAGHRVMAAENGRIALEKLAAQEFDLVLMDIQMPEMDGLEATRRIRESELGTGRRIPIVALTAHAMGGDRERFLSQGMDEYLSKPLRARDLHRVIQELFPPRSRGEDLCPSA
jgi:signal transduction histidine kinase/ActR/RegA family two-component response regulator